MPGYYAMRIISPQMNADKEKCNRRDAESVETDAEKKT
jgi:hypothetical protein